MLRSCSFQVDTSPRFTRSKANRTEGKGTVLRFFFMFAAVGLLVIPGHAQTQPESTVSADAPDRSYKLLREDENWSFLATPALRQDFWDPIKFIPLRRGSDTWYLTI